MEILIHATSKLVYFNGIPCRIWEGMTVSGIKLHAYVARVAIYKDEPRKEEFDRELTEVAAPSPEIEAIPLRMII